MESTPKVTFKNLKANIASSIKESCYRFDARLYNIANEVQRILTMSFDANFETTDVLSKVVDKTIKDSVGMGCDLSVIAKGILLGAFRSTSFLASTAQHTINTINKEVLQSIFKCKGDSRQAIEGILAAAVIIANEYKLNAAEVLIATREDILSSAKALDPKFAEDIVEALPNPDASS